MNKSKPELSWNHTYVYRNPNMIWEMILRQCLRGWSMVVFSAAAAVEFRGSRSVGNCLPPH